MEAMGTILEPLTRFEHRMRKIKRQVLISKNTFLARSKVQNNGDKKLQLTF